MSKGYNGNLPVPEGYKIEYFYWGSFTTAVLSKNGTVIAAASSKCALSLDEFELDKGELISRNRVIIMSQELERLYKERQPTGRPPKKILGTNKRGQLIGVRRG